jgi:diguanylate cyclase (GGDEF)-like protein
LQALQHFSAPAESPSARVAATGLPHPPCADVFERPTRVAARLSRSAGSFLALVDAGRLSLRCSTGPAAGGPAIGAVVGPAGEIGDVIASFVKIGDVATEAWPKGHPAVADFKAASFISAPVVWGGGHTIGCLCVFDTSRRTWSRDEVELLAELAASIGASLELQALGRRREAREPDARPESVTRLRSPRSSVPQSLAPEELGAGDLLRAVAVASNEATTRMQVLQSCLDRVCAHMGWHVGHAYLVSCNRLVPASLWHLADSEKHRLFREASEVAALGSDRGLVARALNTGEASWSTDLASDLPYLRAALAARAGLRSGLALPVRVRDDVLAVLEFYCEKDTRPSDEVLSLMMEVTSQLGRVFERERARSMLEEHAEQVRAKAATDELTGLHNRRGFFDEGPERLKLANRDARSVALFFVDLNAMKLINDQFGHEYGDRALVDTADLLRETFHAGDLIARLGGDEFAVLASHESPEELKVLGARLQGEIDALNASRRRPYRLSASVGAAIYQHGESTSFEELIARADTLMYEQKRKSLLFAGRTRPTGPGSTG